MFDNPKRPEWYTESNENVHFVRQFFDIYENKEKNDEIIRKAMSVEKTDKVESYSFLSLLLYSSYKIN